MWRLALEAADADGSLVTVADLSGTVLGRGRLREGTQRAEGVTFAFTVRDIPRNSEGVLIQLSSRGRLPYSTQRLEKVAWVVHLEAG